MLGHVKALVSKPLHQEAFFVFLGQFISAVGTLVGVKMLTTILQPETYGLVALGMSAANLFIYMLGAPVGSAATRFFHVAVNGGCLPSYEQSLGKVGLLIGVPLLVATVVLALMGNGFYALVGFLALLLCIDAAFNGIQIGARNRRTVAFMQTLLNWSRFLFAVALVVMFGRERVEWVFAGFCASGFMLVGLQFFFYFRKIRAIEPRGTLDEEPFSAKRFKAYLWPLVVVGLISWGQLFIDRWSLRGFASLNDVGIYFALYQISYAPVLLLNSCIYYFISPILFEKAGDAQDPARMRGVYFYNEVFSGITLLLAVGLAATMWLLHGWVGRLLLGDLFAGYSHLLPWLVLSGGIYATGSQLLLSVQSGMDLRPLLFQKVVSAIVAVACYGLGTMWFGLLGAVIGGGVFGCIHAVIAFVLHIRLKGKY